MSKRSHNNSPLRILSVLRVRGSRGPSTVTLNAFKGLKGV